MLECPVQVLSATPDATVELVWRRIEPVQTDAGVSILLTTTIVDAPQADVILVPGGNGVDRLMEDAEVLDFVRTQSERALFVTSVCTGALVLGAAGLLRGRRATTHWASFPLLELFGAIPDRSRVVQDGNLITAVGITSGIDFALTLVAQLRGPGIARAVQLQLEYDPHPPFDAGTPDRPEADPAQVASTLEAVRERRLPIVKRAATRFD